MPCAMMEFDELPHVGFAHHFQMQQYEQNHKKAEDSLEIVYVKEGAVVANSYGFTLKAEAGSVLVLFRNAPFNIRSADGAMHRHCSVQLQLPYRLQMAEDDHVPCEYNGLLLPLVLPPCAETESIKKDLYTIVSGVGSARGERGFSASLAALGILSKLDTLQRQWASDKTASLWVYRIKQYIAHHLHKEICLATLAEALGRTPNYLNSVFRSETGVTIRRFINGEKVQRIAEMVSHRQLSFKAACESVAVFDVSYGYRLFKQYTGMTLGEYLEGATSGGR